MGTGILTFPAHFRAFKLDIGSITPAHVPPGVRIAVFILVFANMAARSESKRKHVSTEYPFTTGDTLVCDREASKYIPM